MPAKVVNMTTQMNPIPSFGALPLSTVSTVVLLSVGCWLVFHFLKALYNVSPLHPLYRIPGPKLAAATYLPEFYYDVVKFGRYTRQIKAMHAKYGPLVRISPTEIHCADVEFSDEIYAIGTRKRNKPAHQVNGTVSVLFILEIRNPESKRSRN